MQKINIDWKNNAVRFQTVNMIILGVGVIFLCIFAYFVYQVVNTNQLIEDTRAEQAKLRGEISYFNLASKLAANDVESYNSLMLRLIPEVEDYFSIIASLERLSLYTGLDVSRYSIDLPEQGSDKFTLSIVGTIPPAIMPLFLSNYQYGTGRLVTIESMTLNNSIDNNVTLVLNFYSRPVTTSNILRVGSLSEEDIQLMKDIQSKITQGEEQAQQLQQLRDQEAQRRQLEELREQQRTATPSGSPSRTATSSALPTPRR